MKLIPRWVIGVAVSLGCFAIWPMAGGAQVVVFDQVGIVGVPVSLAVRTTSLFAAAGGRVVDLELEGEPLGRVMTGADGFGYRRVTPRRAGLLNIAARSKGRQGSGRLLVLEPAEQAVLIELETALKATLFGAAERDDCRSALESIGRRHRLVYVSRWIGADFARTRVAPAGLPDSVVLAWKGSAVLTSLQNQGVQIAALVGSAGVAAEGRSRIEKRFTFEKSRGAVLVGRWSEISEQLNSETPP